VQTRKVTGVKIFVVGTAFYQPLIDFIETKLVGSGMIDKDDLAMIQLTDDLQYVVNEIGTSLSKQIAVLEDVGLENTGYYKSLSKLSGKK
jgi:predicted Rossmann-fold nucleotide-binding protein